MEKAAPKKSNAIQADGAAGGVEPHPARAAAHFESPKQASRYVRHAMSAYGAKSAEEAADRFEQALDEEAKSRILHALLEREAESALSLEEKRASIHELVEDYDSGEYPYKHRYPEKLYEAELFDLQVELLKMQEWVKRCGKRIVVIFEGRDTAGKGGTIRRFVENMNPRGARVVALPKPTEMEAKQWYFQRYAAQLPNPGEICFFDRSWYNRGVVEPVMGFCTQEQTDVFLAEVSQFEKSLIRSGIILIKFWLSISKEEQLRRFKDRQVNPLKRWKLSPVDVASIDKWNDYTRAMEAMFRASDTPDAPWTVILNEDKRRGRLNAIRVLLQSVKYDNRDLKKVGSIDPLIVGRSGLLLQNTEERLFTGAMTAALRQSQRERSSEARSRREKEAKKRIAKLESEIKRGMRRKLQ